jgi:hypothetical protein
MELTARDIEILRKLGSVDGYKYLTSTQLYLCTKHLARNKGKLKNRLTELRRWGYISRRDQDTSEDGIRVNTHDAVYQLDQAGKRELIEHAIEAADFEWLNAGIRHDFSTCAAVASMELFASENGMEFLPPSFFAARTDEKHPFRYTNVKIKNTTMDNFTPDFPIFGFRYPSGKILPIVGFETDRGTETNSPKDLEHSSVLKHILCYNELDRKDAFVKRFNLTGNFYGILIQTTSELRKRNMMEAFKNVIASPEIFFFTTIPTFAKFSRRSAPTGELLSRGLSRIGHREFFLSKPEEE